MSDLQVKVKYDLNRGKEDEEELIKYRDMKADKVMFKDGEMFIDGTRQSNAVGFEVKSGS